MRATSANAMTTHVHIIRCVFNCMCCIRARELRRSSCIWEFRWKIRRERPIFETIPFLQTPAQSFNLNSAVSVVFNASPSHVCVRLYLTLYISTDCCLPVARECACVRCTIFSISKCMVFIGQVHLLSSYTSSLLLLFRGNLSLCVPVCCVLHTFNRICHMEWLYFRRAWICVCVWCVFSCAAGIQCVCACLGVERTHNTCWTTDWMSFIYYFDVYETIFLCLHWLFGIWLFSPVRVCVRAMYV